jgi:tape measure domain-containing protein
MTMRQESVAVIASHPDGKALALEMGDAVAAGIITADDYNSVVKPRVPWTLQQIAEFTDAVRAYPDVSAIHDFEEV